MLLLLALLPVAVDGNEVALAYSSFPLTLEICQRIPVIDPPLSPPSPSLPPPPFARQDNAVAASVLQGRIASTMAVP